MADKTFQPFEVAATLKSQKTETSQKRTAKYFSSINFFAPFDSGNFH